MPRYSYSSSGGQNKSLSIKEKILGGGIGIVGILFIIVLFACMIGAIQSCGKTGATEVAVIRNGGPFDSKDIRKTVGPHSALMVPGLASDWHKYPSGQVQRYYNISSNPDDSDSKLEDFIEVPTADGVLVKLDAQTFFRTAFTDADGNVNEEVLRDFDDQFGNRKFDVPGDDGEKYPYEGDDGFAAWLHIVFRPLLENAVREEIGQFECSELLSSCALIQQSQTAGQPDFTALGEKGEQNQKNFEKVQNAIQSKISERLEATLHNEYLTDIQFKLVKVTPPDDVQSAINTAQSSFAQVSEAKAQAAKSKFEAQRLAELARQYARSPGLAVLDTVKECDNSQCTVILDATGKGVGINLGK